VSQGGMVPVQDLTRIDANDVRKSRVFSDGGAL
jgi:hypothetical protein